MPKRRREPQILVLPGQSRRQELAPVAAKVTASVTPYERERSGPLVRAHAIGPDRRPALPAGGDLQFLTCLCYFDIVMPMPSPAGSLRERQAEQIRTTVLETVVRELESRPVDDLSMGDVAEAAGISLRTLYRYFPDRPSLLSAAGQHVVGSLNLPVEIDGPAAISASFLQAASRFSARPQLARALVQTTAGRAARSSARPQRTEAVGEALRPLTDKLDPATARRAAAVISHLCSLQSWVSIANESGLDDTESQAAVAWAIDTLVAALGSNRPSTHQRRKRGS